MKTGILVCSGTGKEKNIGDYLQSVAQEQFLPKDSLYIERESLNSVESDEPIKLIMNGWFMHQPQNFPPSPAINPLFISFHITPKIVDAFFSEETVNYLKQHEPIGARDKGTLALLQSKGIKSWFSGCLTLTLGHKYKATTRNDDVIFVDPYFEIGGNNKLPKAVKYAKAALMFIKNAPKVLKLCRKFKSDFIPPTKKVSCLKKFLATASFYNAYSPIFSDDILLNAQFISHKIAQDKFPTNTDKMNYARHLITKYSQAKFVVTSRIHCALPCIGVETPVLFVNSDALQGNSVRSSGRFAGLQELFHQLYFSSGKVSLRSPELKKTLASKKIDTRFIFQNSDQHKDLAQDMIDRVTAFINQGGQK